MTNNEKNLDDIQALVSVFPKRIAHEITKNGKLEDLIEVVLDLGRPPLARYVRGEARLSNENITEEDLEKITEKISEFDLDNRAGLERTLHRISAIRNRRGKIVGLTCRVGRAVFGTLEIIKDFIESNKSILILGRPGIGKTTMLREAARVLADTKRVVIVDTSNEIGGDGDVPHPAVGKARRMQVAKPNLQHEVMIEAVENHNPEVIVIDEIGRELEAMAARTIAERGVQLIGTAHGRTLSNLLMNPTLSDLIGGIESVTLSDEEARRRGTQKTVLERRSPPTFEVLVELVERDTVIIYQDVAAAVDALVRGIELFPEMRHITSSGKIVHEKAPAPVLPSNNTGNPFNTTQASSRQTRNIIQITGQTKPHYDNGNGSRKKSSSNQQNMADDELLRNQRRPLTTVARKAASPKPMKIYPHGVARNRLAQAASRLDVPILVVNSIDEADILMTLRPYYRNRQSVIVEAEDRNIPIYVLRSNTVTQLENSLANLFDVTVQHQAANWDDVEQETSAAIEAVKRGEVAWMDLTPAETDIRERQHMLIRDAGLLSQSYGKEPQRRIRIFQNPD